MELYLMEGLSISSVIMWLLGVPLSLILLLRVVGNRKIADGWGLATQVGMVHPKSRLLFQIGERWWICSIKSVDIRGLPA